MEENHYSSIQSILDQVIDYPQLSYNERVEAEAMVLKSFVSEYRVALLPLLKIYVGKLK